MRSKIISAILAAVLLFMIPLYFSLAKDIELMQYRVDQLELTVEKMDTRLKIDSSYAKQQIDMIWRETK